MAKRLRKSKPVNRADQILTMLSGDKSPAKPRKHRRHFSPDEHIAWAEANCYRDTKVGGWQPLRYSGWQKKSIRKLLAITPEGLLRYKTIMPCWPRRCGKSEFTAVYDLHRADEYEDQTIVIQGNSADQGEDTVFKAIVDAIRNSPALKAREKPDDITILSDAILFARTGSIIKVQPAAEGSAYGQKISVYHNTELCKAANDKLYQVGASSTGDAWCGLGIIDSNMGDKANPVARYVELGQQAAEEAARAAEEGRLVNPAIGDPAICADYIHFADLEDVIKRGCGVGLPANEEAIHPWLDADWIRSRFAQMTRSEFLRNHCNQPSGAGEVLWSDEQVDPLFAASLDMFLADVSLADATRAVKGDGRWAIGVGLDRANAFSRMPDRTVVAVVGKTTIPELAGKPAPVYDERGVKVADEITDGSVFVLLGAWEYMRCLRDPLQDKMLQIDRQWGIGSAALEAYQASDLGEWCKTQRFGDRCSIEHMTSQAKQQLVQYMHSLVITRRFVASCKYRVLRAELTNYREDASGGGIPSYGGPRKTVDLELVNPLDGRSMGRKTTWIKDDYLEAVMWAIYAARNARRSGGGAKVIAKPVGL